jgi:hypothetical protein
VAGSGADRTERTASAEPAAVRLHLHRGIGWGLYGTVTVVVFVFVLFGTVANLREGGYVTAAVVAVLGLGLTAFLAMVTRTMVLPALTVSAAGVSGRTPQGRTVDVGWDEVTIDVDDEALAGTMRLDIDDETVTVNSRSWIGFRDFVILVASTSPAAARLTPAARDEVLRLLKIGG